MQFRRDLLRPVLRHDRHMAATADRYVVFANLHESGCFVIPNPWDAGTAKVLAQRGFPALATTSSGSAWSMGHPDHGVPLDQALAHLALIAGSVDVPVNADFEGGFADRAEDVATNVTRAVEYWSRPVDRGFPPAIPTPLYDFELAVDRIRAARAAIDRSGRRVLLTGRSEGFIAGRPDLKETIRRSDGVRGCGCRMPLCARPRVDRRRRRRRDGRRAEAGERARASDLHRPGSRAGRRPPDQCRRRVRARRVDGVSRRCARGGRARHLHRARPRRSPRREINGLL